ncbi:hypothetical protein HDU97_004810 [Phlyctochytrium planicorne]|nr:hypothetical protein HDU97_004810 [Phlyctochytrium planicorne]
MGNSSNYGYRGGYGNTNQSPTPTNPPLTNGLGWSGDMNKRSSNQKSDSQIDPRMMPFSSNVDMSSSMFKTFDPGSAPLMVDDIISKLRFAEEQLQSERRSRSWLETELQLGKSLVATLSAKVERMQENMAQESQTLKDLVRQAEQTEKRSVQSDQDIIARLERDNAKMHNALADLSARVKMNEQREDEESERQKMVVNELNELRHKVETFSMKTSEVGQEFRAKARDWELETHRGMDFTRMLRDHQNAIDSLQHNLDSIAESTSKKVELSVMELRHKVDQEAKARYMFETGMRDLFSEVKKALSNQDRDLHDRVEVMKNQIILGIDRERQDREKTFLNFAEQMRLLERSMRDSQQMAVDKMASQVANVEDQFAQERIARGKFETACRSEVEETFKTIQDSLDKRTDEMQQGYNDLKSSIGSIVKALKESISLVEKTMDQKFQSLEDVLRAEVKTRMDSDRSINEFRENTETRFNTLERRTFESIADAMEESKTSIERLEEDIKSAAEQLASSKSRILEDVEKQLSQSRTRMKEFEVEIGSKFRQVQLTAEQIGRDAQQNLEAAEAKLDGKLAAAFVNDDDLASRIRDIETKGQLVKSDIEDKLNIRAMQVDTAFEALKMELDLRTTKKDANDMEVRFEASMANVQASVAHLQDAFKDVRDEIEVRATRKEVDDVELKSKQLFASLQGRLAETDSSLISLKEDISERGLKKDLEDLESRTKASILDLQVRDAELENQIDRTREDMGSRVGREQMTAFEERMKDQLHTAESRSEQISDSVSALRDAIALKISKAELMEFDEHFKTSTTDINEKINDMSTAILETRGDISKAIHDDLEDMVTKINSTLEEMQLKIDTYEGSLESVKVRISDVDVAGRGRLQQVSDSLQVVIAENTATVTGLKDLTNQKLEDFAMRLEEVPKQLQQAEQQYDDFRRKLLEFNRADSEKLNQLLNGMRESVSQKVSEQEFDRLQTEVRTTMSRILAQQEIEQMSLEQSRLKLSEVETNLKERCRELKVAQERGFEEQMISFRVMRDSSSKKLDEMEVRLAGLPKAIDQAWIEIRKLHSEVDEQLRVELLKLEREMNVLRGEVGAKISEKAMDISIKEAIAPFSIRVERINHDIDELKFATERVRSDLKAFQLDSLQSSAKPPLPVAMSSVPPRRELYPLDSNSSENYNSRNSNYYKPDFAKTDGKLPPLPNDKTPLPEQAALRTVPSRGSQERPEAVSTPPQSQSQPPPLLKSFTRGSDPELEKLADMAMNAGPNLPPLSRKSSMNEF